MKSSMDNIGVKCVAKLLVTDGQRKRQRRKQIKTDLILMIAVLFVMTVTRKRRGDGWRITSN